MESCGICNEITEVREVWNIFRNTGIVIVNDISVSKSIFPNNNICEDCSKKLSFSGIIYGKNGFGYKFPRSHIREN